MLNIVHCNKNYLELPASKKFQTKDSYTKLKYFWENERPVFLTDEPIV